MATKLAQPERPTRVTPAEKWIWETFGKPLTKKKIKTFLGVVSEEEAKKHNDFVLLRYDVSDTTALKGDGKSLVRNSDCDIIVQGTGTIFDNWIAENAWEVEQILNSLEIGYRRQDNGYDDSSNTSSITISFAFQYSV